MKRRIALLLMGSVAIAVAAAALPWPGSAQEEPWDPDAWLDMPAPEGMQAEREETRAWRLAEAGRMIKAREAATTLLKRRPRSYVAHLVLGYVQHYAEGNFPRALFHLEKSMALYQQRHGRAPAPPAVWRWHSRLLIELALTHGDLEHHQEKVDYLNRYNALYDPDFLAERAWPMMKLGRYPQARRYARAGIATGDRREQEVGLNALCAIEFEAGNDGASYQACRRAMEFARQTPGSISAVDLTNFAEASRSLFKLDEAERITQEATRADVAWYGNPWLDLAELYTREGRFAEALAALKEIPRYRQQRPPHVRDSDRNESRRSLSSFFVVVGRPWDAIRITSKALVAPDRRAHNSRDPAQDRAIAALLDRRARLLAAEMHMEDAAGYPWHEWPSFWLTASWLRVQAWMSGRQAARSLADDTRLVGTFRIGTSTAAIMQPWLAGELVEVAGSGVVREAVARARRRDRRPGAGAYYDAFEAEAALAGGDEERAVELVTRSLAALGPAEVLLRARLEALGAEASRRAGDGERAMRWYDSAYQSDPGVFRRLGLTVPVRIDAGRGEVAEELASMVSSSPRFSDEGWGFVVGVEGDATRARACLRGPDGTEYGCGEAQARAHDDPEALARRTLSEFHKTVFAPRIDLSQADANSLDGSNRVGRDPLRTLFDEGAGTDAQPGME